MIYDIYVITFVRQVMRTESITKSCFNHVQSVLRGLSTGTICLISFFLQFS